MEQILFRTVTGSHMWGDQRPASDLDISEVYVVPTKTILEGRPYPVSKPQKKDKSVSPETETTYWEIGHLIRQLIKGNQNAIWMVCSGFVLDTTVEHELLERIVRSNVASCTCHSIKGMAENQWKDATKRNLGIKGIRSAWRTANFGCILLDTGKIEFNRTPSGITEESLKLKLRELDMAYESSSLPEKPDPEPYYHFMYETRNSMMERV